ncbi:MAG: hypothetical protein U5R31_16230 [Acidimicrobiia bacterium]|nr:hypothetical protein [Acidimicrobiia bacterium]
MLGTQLDVSEDDGPDISSDDPDRHRKELYHYLAWLLDDVVTAAVGGCDPRPSGRRSAFGGFAVRC